MGIEQAAAQIGGEMAGTFGEYGIASMACGSKFDASQLCSLPQNMQGAAVSRISAIGQAVEPITR